MLRKDVNVVYSLITELLAKHCCIGMFVIAVFLVIFVLYVYPIMVSAFSPSVVTALY